MKKFLALFLMTLSTSVFAQIAVSDGTLRGTCSSASVASGSIVFNPSGCLGTIVPPTTNTPNFTVRFSRNTATQSTTEQQHITVYVDADRDIVAGARHELTFNYCVSEHGCNPNLPQANSPQTVFFRYGGLGGSGFTAADAFNTLRQPFVFVPGDGQAAPVNNRTMGVGLVIVFPTTAAPALNATKTVTAGITGAGASPTISYLTINKPPTSTVGDVDINGSPIPNTNVAYGKMCEYLGQSGIPGPYAGNPCGAYRIDSSECSTGMTGDNAITKSYLLPIENYDPMAGRLGNSIRLALTPDASMSFRFKTLPAGNYSLPRPLSVAIDEFGPNGANAPRFISISEKRCDFDYRKLDFATNGGITPQTFCYKTDASATIIGMITSTGNDPSIGITTCQLKPDTTYYLNVRYEYAVGNNRGRQSCPKDAGYYQNSCGAVIGIN